MDGKTDETTPLVEMKYSYLDKQFQKERSYVKKKKGEVELLHTEADNWQNLAGNLCEQIDHLKIKNDDLSNK